MDAIGNQDQVVDSAFGTPKPVSPSVFRPIQFEAKCNTDIHSKPWHTMDARKISAGSSEVPHLYQHGQYAITRLFSLRPDEVPQYDVAEMNLVCAYGLSGKHDIEIGTMLKLLDVWAKRCWTYIAQKMPSYQADRDEFSSIAKFRVRLMIQVLTKQLGVRYNPLMAGEPGERPPPITDPLDTFIHGILGAKRTGTCASLPVVLTAIGRRLGYPLKLVMAPEHCFCRWDSPEERFNIEYCERGISFHPDAYYTEWPFKWPPEVHERQRARPYFLVSLQPHQELAVFAWNRGYHLNSIGGRRRLEALANMQVAQRLWPTHTHACWTLHLTTKALYPERQWPRAPSEETAEREAMERLVREKGVLFKKNAVSGWIKGEPK